MLKLSKNIKMVISDFDGVFTDGSVYFDEKLIIALESTDGDTKALCEKLESVYDFIRVIPFERIKNEWEKIFES